MAAFIALTFRQYGISNDEEVQHIYGRLLLNFYGSGFADQSAFHYKNLYLYGGLFDLLAAGLEKLLPFWVWDMRHLLSATFGLAGLFAAYKIGRQLGGERAGFLALLFLSITGAWSGAMFTHTKDAPFATCMLWALYYSMQATPRLPKLPLKLSLKLGIAIGCALGLRIGGVFAVLYLGMLLALATYAAYRPGVGLRDLVSFCLVSIRHLLPAALIAFLLMALFWPWAVMSPSHPLEAAKAFSHFAFDMLTMVDGHVLRIGDVPATYLIEYLTVRLPEIVLVGLLCLLLISLVQLVLYRGNRILTPRFSDTAMPMHSNYALQASTLLPWSALLIAAVFPLAFTLWDRPALYNGVRHFTFVVPPLVILAALGIHQGLQLLANKPKTSIAFSVLLGLLVLNTSITLVNLYPYQYVYYNKLAGTTAHAVSNWEADYWSSSIREAAHILQREVDKTGDKGPYTVAVCAESLQASAYLDPRFSVTKDWISADFYLSSTSMHCDQVLQGVTIGRVERLGASLAVIKDRRNLRGDARLPHPAFIAAIPIK